MMQTEKKRIITGTAMRPAAGSRLAAHGLMLAGLLAAGPASLAASYPDKGGAGSCTFVNPFAGTDDCVQYNGANWTETTAAADCATLFSSPYPYQFNPGGICSTLNHAADCVEDLGTPDEKINENVSTLPSFCNTLSGVCNVIIGGDYFTIAGSVCDTGPGPVTCEELEPEACAAIESDGDVEVTFEANFISFLPLTATRRPSNVILFPGAAVVPEAYAPLARELARNGIHTSVLNGPDGTLVPDVLLHPDNAGVTNWIVAGHSLGGVTAAKYITANPGTIAGLGLMASFPDTVDDLSASGIRAVSIYGSNDLIVTPEEAFSGVERLPAKTPFVRLRGGNHAQFGFYGPQPGDGEADISGAKQLELIAATLRHLVARVEAGVPDSMEVDGTAAMNDLSIEHGARFAFLAASGFGLNGIPLDDIDVLRAATQGDFISAYPSAVPDRIPEIEINQLLNQLGNPDDIGFAPVYDGEVVAKFLSQARIEKELNRSTPEPQGSCADANRENVALAQSVLGASGIFNASDAARLQQWTWTFAPDVLFPTGPDFIADPSSAVVVSVDELNRTVAVQSPSFFATLDPANGAAAGRHYCKTLSYERIFLTQRQLIAATPGVSVPENGQRGGSSATDPWALALLLGVARLARRRRSQPLILQSA